MAWARTAVEWGWTLKWWSLVGGGIGGTAFWGPGAWELAIGNRERNGGCWTGIPGEAAQNAIIPTGKGEFRRHQAASGVRSSGELCELNGRGPGAPLKPAL